MIQAIIFDIDGTILDTEDAIMRSLKQATDEAGYSYSIEDLRFVFGVPGEEALPKLHITDVNAVLDRCHELERIALKKTKPFKNIENVIRELSLLGIKLGVVTSKSTQQYKETMEQRECSQYFDEVVVTECTQLHKPHGEPLLYCLERMDVAPHEAIYIGDTIYDNQCAEDAGAKFGLAYWGAKTTDGFQADYVLEHPSDLLKLVVDTNVYHF